MTRAAGDEERPDVSLSPFSRDHADLVAGWLSNPGVNRWLYGEFRFQQVSGRQVLLLASSPRNHLMVVNCGDVPCGLVALSQINQHDASADIWYLIGDAAYEGKGVATRAVQLALRVAFGERGLHSLSASVMGPNIASRRVLERSGFRLAGVLREGVRLGDEFVDRLLYDVLRQDIPGEGA